MPRDDWEKHWARYEAMIKMMASNPIMKIYSSVTAGWIAENWTEIKQTMDRIDNASN